MQVFQVVPGRSKCLIALLVAVHGCVAVAYGMASLPWGWIVAGWSAVAVSLGYGLWREGQGARVTLVFGRDGYVVSVDSEGRRYEHLLASVVEGPWAIWLRCEPAKVAAPAARFMICRDAVPAASWRMLRIWVRHCSRIPGDTATPRRKGETVSGSLPV